MPDPAASINFDRLAAIYEETRGGLKRGRSYARTIGPRLRSGTVLEIGIGTASVALPLTDDGHAVVGVDLSANMLALAHERIGARVAIADVMALPVADGTVPNVVAVWVLQLVGSVEAALREARRVLSPGGRLVVITSRGRADPDDIEEASVDFQAVLRGRRQDDPDLVIALGEATSFLLVERLDTEVQQYDDTPCAVADRIEGRGYGILLDLAEEDWQRVVVPVIGALRALPDQDTPRHRVTRNDVLVFEAV